MNKPCDYCREPWKPLFRYINTYVREYRCVDEDDDCDRNEESCFGLACDNYEPQYNRLNITVAISGNRLMFEDKHGEGNTDDRKRFVEIKFCPMCGRELA